MARYSYKRNNSGRKAKKVHFAALCACMVALGAVSWFALDMVGNVPAGQGDTSSKHSSSKPNYIFNTVSDAPGPVSSESEKEPEKPPEKEEQEMPTVGEATFFVMPVAGSVIKDYSPTEPLFSETFLDFRVHKGVDISAKSADVVGAAGHGVVKTVGYSDQLGHYVEIDHGNGIVCFYAGLGEHIMVAQGQALEASQPIGTIGTVPCECVDAPHLHLEVVLNGKQASPMEVLGLK